MSTEVKPTHNYSYKDGAIISPLDITKWHKEVLDKLSNDDYKENFTYIRSGNSLVLGIRDMETGITIMEFTSGYHSYNYAKTKD